MRPYRAALAEILGTWQSPRFRLLAAEGLGLFALSCVANFIGGMNATKLAHNWVTDAVLSNTEPVGSLLLHLTGPAFLDAFMVLFVLRYPRYIPFLGKALALIIFARAVAINLTHIGIYPDALPVTGSVFTFGGDLFYSNHTAIPLMLGFVIRKEHPVTGACLFLTGAVFGLNSLLAHVHYSIDVFVAPFMAHGVYAFTKWLSPEDWHLIDGHRKTLLERMHLKGA